MKNGKKSPLTFSEKMSAVYQGGTLAFFAVVTLKELVTHGLVAGLMTAIVGYLAYQFVKAFI